MAQRTGRYAMIEQFLADGITHMFGNPGTVEQGFLDVLKDFPEFKYILTLQETVAAGVADGYARATKEPTVLQLHSGVGLGNGIGMMYQSMRGHAPLIVLAGEAGTQYDATDAQMAADLVAMAEPVTKWATRVIHPTSLLRVLRKAIKIATTAPMGPVFVSLPMDILDAPAVEKVVPTSRLVTRTSPDPNDIVKIVGMLANAQNPMIIMGDGISFSGAEKELTRVAELCGAEVWGSDCSEANMDNTHPLFSGLLGHMFGEHSKALTSKADAILICGTYVFPDVFPALDGVFASAKHIAHIDLNAYEIAKNFPVDLGIVADPKRSLAAIADELQATMSSDRQARSAKKMKDMGDAKAAELSRQIAADEQVKDEVPMHASVFMSELAKALPEDAIIFDEALTASPDFTRYFPPRFPGTYYQTRGGSLGVGFPGAIGMKIANPDKTVVGLAGDGGSMYTIQSMWTAAHHNINAKFVVNNNQNYMLLKLNIMQYWKERGMDEHEFPAAFTLKDPVLNFAAMAEAMGVKALRVEKPSQVADAVKQMFEHDGPFLIDLVVSDHVPGSTK
jgi:benzoylformate decarboxylase